MRSTSQRFSLIPTLVVFLCAFATVTCSSDKNGGDGSSNAGSAAPGPVVFNTPAGKTCTANSDCGNGTCRLMFPGLGGVAQPAPGGYCTFKCNLSADCGPNATCGSVGGNLFGGQPAESLCLASCNANTSCRDGYRCMDVGGQAIGAQSTASGSCQIKPPTDTIAGKIAGSSCESNADCGGGRCSMNELNTDLPGGYCTGRCLADSDCGDQAVCAAAFAGATGICFRSCESDSECGRDGYRCRAQIGQQAKLCVPGYLPLPNGKVGLACTADSECGSEGASCATTRMLVTSVTFPEGYCTQEDCVDASDCGSGGACLGVGAFRVGLLPGCYKTCAGDTECRQGYHCTPGGRATGMTTPPNVCAPILPDTDQDAGMP
ncbi:MAG: hypothetical protein RL701_5164 [Pseudomonadota bacterium]|jgi:hypothetical protein